MSPLQNPSSSLPPRQLAYHASVERQGLALGASRERARCASSSLADISRSPDEADQNKYDQMKSSDPELDRVGYKKADILQEIAELFRDDTWPRALFMNSLLLITAIGVVAFAYT